MHESAIVALESRQEAQLCKKKDLMLTMNSFDLKPISNYCPTHNLTCLGQNTLYFQIRILFWNSIIKKLIHYVEIEFTHSDRFAVVVIALLVYFQKQGLLEIR
jgi:hypothetical protein